MTARPRAGTVVIGIGNVIRSDDGLGVHAVRRLRERWSSPSDVELIDGGTAGLMLLPYLADADRAIIVDAIAIGAPAGSLVRLDRGEGVFPTGTTPHDVGLSDLLDAMRLTAATPRAFVLHGIQPASTELGTDLTPVVADALDALVTAVEAELAGWSAADLPCTVSDDRSSPEQERHRVPGHSRTDH